MAKSARTLEGVWPSRDASTFLSTHQVQHFLESKQRHQLVWQWPWHGCRIWWLLGLGFGQDSELPPSLQPVADLLSFSSLPGITCACHFIHHC